jgi:hypothetical protein
MDGKPRNRKESDKLARKLAKVNLRNAKEKDYIAQHLRKREAKSELKASLTKKNKCETDSENAQAQVLST